VFAHRVFENKKILAFLDIHPLSKGHTLVIPKCHVAQLEELVFEEGMELFKAI
jgi:histidine triad (HIT) family protein